MAIENENERPADETIWIIIFGILSLIAIILDTLIIYKIIRLGRPQRKADYVFLANRTFADLAYMITVFISNRMKDYHLKIDYSLLCLLSQSAQTFFIVEMIFFTVMAVDWCLSTYFPRASDKFRKFADFVVLSVWILFLAVLGTCTYLCVNDRQFSATFMLIVVTCLIIFVLVLVLNICRIFAPSTNDDSHCLMLTLTTIFALFWLPVSLLAMEPENDTVFIILRDCAMTLCPALIFIVLCKCNEHFGDPLLRIFKRSSYQEVSVVTKFENNTLEGNHLHDSGRVSFGNSSST